LLKGIYLRATEWEQAMPYSKPANKHAFKRPVFESNRGGTSNTLYTLSQLGTVYYDC
jgi:hypothetical protein